MATKKKTLMDRWLKTQERRAASSRVSFMANPEVGHAIRQVAKQALERASSGDYEGNEIEVAIASADGLVSPYGEDISFRKDRVEYIEGGVLYTTEQVSKGGTRRVKEDLTRASTQITAAEEKAREGYNETLEPPWSFDMLSRLMATSAMHAAAIETKSADYSYSGWMLKDREETRKRLKDGTLKKEIVDQAREEAINFLKHCSDTGGPIEDVCRDLALDYEKLGCGAVEGLRKRSGLLSGLKSLSFNTIRFLNPVSEAAKAGAKYRQKRGEVSRYFAGFGDITQYTNPDFDPMKASIDEFPGPEIEKRSKFIEWKPSIPFSNKPESGPFSFENSASELFVLPRRPFTMSDSYGTPSGIQALGAMLALRKIEEYNLQFFESKGVPQYAIVITGLKKGRPSTPNRTGTGTSRNEDSITALTNVITNYFTHKIKASDRSVLVMRLFGEVQVKFEKLSSEKVEASFAEYEDRNKEDIRMSHRMPPAALGINQETANIGSGRDSTQMRRYRDHIVVPGQRQFAMMVNQILRIGLLIPYFEFCFEPIALDEEEARREVLLDSFRSGAITTNEYRRTLPGNFGDLSPEEGGDIRQFPPGATLVGQDLSSVQVAVQRANQNANQMAQKMIDMLRESGKLPYPDSDTNSIKRGFQRFFGIGEKKE